LGTIELGDLRGYFKELAGPAFEEFWFEYQENLPVDIGRFVLIYRRLITAMFFLNHMTDKAAKHRGVRSPEELIRAVRAVDPKAAEALDICRMLTNDVKHVKNNPQSYGLRDRAASDEPGSSQLPSWTYTDNTGKQHDLCDVAERVWRYWVDYRHQRQP
jgi:hypothetical protein